MPDTSGHSETARKQRVKSDLEVIEALCKEELASLSL